ncbi:hypothetical protein HXX76_004277 [Chlamydomonas incerta]|uniref:SET domain-containing protein n=1 Tax=Chlamydomonas incerta TaxID=51695 RepID=A0A835TH01_CHLIN|nr:hypothetical protein HXX76_004277 [Chlamydomonas incerta]|eukprot:KAG2440164.1 hypothetical protein HXX76_004277 [Chlamydomonas incerta]
MALKYTGSSSMACGGAGRCPWAAGLAVASGSGRTASGTGHRLQPRGGRAPVLRTETRLDLRSSPSQRRSVALHATASPVPGAGASGTAGALAGAPRGAAQPPLQLVAIPGKGRGVVAARPLSPGELLLTCRPLALVQGPSRPGGSGSSSSGVNEAALVEALLKLEWPPRQAHILDSLFRGAAPPPSLAPGGKGGAAGRGSHGGSSDSCTDVSLAELADPWGFLGDGSSTAALSGSTGSSSPAAVSPAMGGERPSCPLTPQQLAAAVRLNATGLPADDALLAALRRLAASGSSSDGNGSSSKGAGAGGQAFIGLWPAHAMFNHSCAPNAVAVVSDGVLTLRCCAPVPAGGELCITYAGALGLGPLPLRRALLERNHRFMCSCARCRAEERLPRELTQLWTDIVMLASQSLQPNILAAAAAMKQPPPQQQQQPQQPPKGGQKRADAGAGAGGLQQALAVLLDVRSQAAKCMGLFEETLGQLAPSPQEALWLQASMYPLYETRARCAQLLAEAAAQAAATGGGAALPDGVDPALLGEEYLEALSSCLRLQGVANAGSDMHVQLAARYEAACVAHAARHPAVPRAAQQQQEATTRLGRALTARYGCGASSSSGGAAPAVAAAAVAPSGGDHTLEEFLVAVRKLQRQ